MITYTVTTKAAGLTGNRENDALLPVPRTLEFGRHVWTEATLPRSNTCPSWRAILPIIVRLSVFASGEDPLTKLPSRKDEWAAMHVLSDKERLAMQGQQRPCVRQAALHITTLEENDSRGLIFLSQTIKV